MTKFKIFLVGLNLILAATAFVALGQVTNGVAFDPKQRFDDLVRDDLFSGEPERVKKAMTLCEETLAKNPRHAAAMVWHGSGLVGMSGTPFRQGDFAKGMDLWTRGLKEMDDAVAIAPDSLQTIIPRGATLLGVAKYDPDLESRKQMIRTGVGDYEKILRLQTNYFTNLSTHARGELLFGLADGWYRLGETNRSRVYLRRIESELHGSKYAAEAKTWLTAPTDAALRQKSETRQCVGCHDR